MRAARSSCRPVTPYLSSSTFKPRTLENFGYSFLPVDGHDMDSGHAGNGSHFGDDLAAELQAFSRDLVSRYTAQPADNGVRNVHAGHLLAHMVQRAQRLDRSDPRENEAALVDSEIAQLPHPLPENPHVVDELRLTKLGTGRGFLAESLGAPLQRGRKRIFDGA